MPMEDPGSVTRHLKALKESDRIAFDAAVRALWERYFNEMARRAQARLGNAPRCVNTGEDVALSAFFSFVDRAARGKFPCLTDRHELWRLLIRITACKAARQYRRPPPCTRNGVEIARLVSSDASPDVLAMMEEELTRLRQALRPDCQDVADRKLEGYTNQEIAEELGWSTRKVERKLSIIRDTWAAQHPEDPEAE